MSEVNELGHDMLGKDALMAIFRETDSSLVQELSLRLIRTEKELLALRKAIAQPVGTIEATCDYVTDVDWLQDIDSGEYLVIRKPNDSTT